MLELSPYTLMNFFNDIYLFNCKSYKNSKDLFSILIMISVTFDGLTAIGVERQSDSIETCKKHA